MKVVADTYDKLLRANGFSIVRGKQGLRHFVKLAGYDPMEVHVTGHGDSFESAVVDAYYQLYGKLSDKYFTLGVLLDELKTHTIEV